MKTPAMKELETNLGKPIREVLIEVYAKHGNQAGAAAELGVSQGTFSLWLKLVGLRKHSILVLEERQQVIA